MYSAFNLEMNWLVVAQALVDSCSNKGAMEALLAASAMVADDPDFPDRFQGLQQ